MNHPELETIDRWLLDPSFINWANGSNEADIAKWDAYFSAHPEHVEWAEVAKFSMTLEAKPMEIDKSKSMTALAKLKTQMSTAEKQSTTKVRRMSDARLWQVAASMLLLVGCLGVYTIMNGGGEEIIVATAEDQKEHILEDGTKVVLNAHASLKYYENEVRNVQLEGEAYFEVTKQTETGAPFLVKTADLTITVLGTAFNVDSDNDQTSVFLKEGKVKLSLGDNAEGIMMTPGDLVTYSKRKNKVLENRKANTLAETAWKEKVILFFEASLSEVLETVSLIYNVKLDSKLSLDKGQLFTGGIPVNNLEIALSTIKEIYQINISKIEEQYIIE